MTKHTIDDFKDRFTSPVGIKVNKPAEKKAVTKKKKPTKSK